MFIDFYNLSNVDGLKETIAALGEKFNKQDKANEILDEIKEVENKVNSNKKSDDKILVLFGAPGSVMVATDKSYIGNLVELAGGNNIFSNATSSFTQINLEEIIKLNPDKILFSSNCFSKSLPKVSTHITSVGFSDFIISISGFIGLPTSVAPFALSGSS